MSELEKGLKEQLESVIKQNQMLLEKHYQQDGKIVKLIGENSYYKSQLQQKENIIKEVREDLHQVVKWCTENKHNEDTIERYLVVDYGTITGKINEIRTKLDKGEK